MAPKKISIDHFVEKLINLSGQPSTSSQVVDVKYDLLMNRKRIDSLEGKMDDISRKLDQLLAKR